MLNAISWLAFAKFLATATAIYYAGLASLFFRKELKQLLARKNKLLLLAPMAVLGTQAARAQDGNQGISQANTLIRGYFDTGVQLMYAIGAIFALIGAIHTYKEWNAGHQREAYQAAAGWFGSCIFLVIVATVIRSFFGL
jgi:hypothetical protein